MIESRSRFGSGKLRFCDREALRQSGPIRLSRDRRVADTALLVEKREDRGNFPHVRKPTGRSVNGMFAKITASLTGYLGELLCD
jgi:hypothetical protein